MEENKSKGIFLGVVGVATLIVAIIGATFAYFVASASGNTNAVQAAGADVSGTLKLDEDVSGIKNNMIPVSEEVMKKSFVQAGTGATANALVFRRQKKDQKIQLYIIYVALMCLR